jgi:hypothetical protein
MIIIKINNKNQTKIKKRIKKVSLIHPKFSKKTPLVKNLKMILKNILINN